jgi:ribosomal-protein-alanine N-acetyltransferase
MEQVKFRSMELTDIPRVMEVEKRSFPTPWPEKAFYDEILHNQFARYEVVEVDGVVAGYCGMWLILDEAHITNIAIHPDYRGKGLGKALLKHMMQLAASLGSMKMTLEVRVSNEIAQSLYRKMGFEATGIRPRYYSDNQEDAMIMWVNLHDQRKELSRSRN